MGTWTTTGLFLQSRNEAVDNLKVFAPSEYLNQNYIPTLVVEYIAPSENNPPAIGPIGDKSVNEGEVLTFTVSGSDPDGDSLTYNAENLPPGASFDSNIGEFNWTPGLDQAGVYTNVLFTVTDNGNPVLTDTESISITVGSVNRAPVLSVIGDKIVDEGGLLTFTVSGSDPDGDSLTYNAENLPPGAAFNSNTGEFNWTPGLDQAGVYMNVLFTVTDNGNPVLTDTESISITVGSVNRAPVLSVIGDKIVDEGGLLTFTVSGSDPDGDSLTYNVENLPAGASFDSNTGEFNWTPGYDQAGAYANILFTVTDGGTPSLSDSEPVTISVGDVNRVPVLNSIGDKSVNEGDVLTFRVSGSDPDGDSLTYNAENLPPGAAFNSNTGEFNWTPGLDQAGVYTNVLFTVTDNGNPVLTDTESISITVGSVNRAPVLSVIGDKIVDEGGLLTFTVSGSDPDGDFLTYNAENLPPGAAFNSNTGEFNWTPGYDQAGVYADVLFSVTDDGEPALTDTESISITVGSVNRAPVLSVIGDKTIDEGGSLTFTVSGSDPDGDTLTYNAENLPAGASFDPLTREFNWETTTGDAGDYSVLFSVADDGIPSKSDTEEIFISVFSPYQPVTVELSGTSTVEDTMIAGGSYSLHNLGGAKNYLEVGAYGISVRSLIRWDLSEIPNGSTIISAEMSLYCYQDYTGGQITIDAYRMLTAWVEGTLIDQDRSLDDPDSACWTEYGYGQAWAQNGAGGETDRDPIIESSVTGSGTGWYTWDITNAAQDWVDGYLDNNGLILQSRNEAVDNLKVFAPSEYSNQSYIPTLVIEYLPPSNSSPSSVENFMALGDSITAGSHDDISTDGTGYEPILEGLLSDAAGYNRYVLNEGFSGDTSADGLTRLPDILSNYPEADYFLILFGTNDAWAPTQSGLGLQAGEENYSETFKDNMQQMITMVEEAGKIPYLAKIPAAYGESAYLNPAIQEYNQVIDELISENSINVVAPDLYTYFSDNPSELSSDGLHPDGTGYQSIAQLWFDALNGSSD